MGLVGSCNNLIIIMRGRAVPLKIIINYLNLHVNSTNRGNEIEQISHGYEFSFCLIIILHSTN